MDASNAIVTATRGRWAVATIFFVNGFLTGSWAPQIPLVLTRLDITEFTLGLLILCFGLGALSAMPWSGYLMSRHGTRRVLRVFGVGQRLRPAAGRAGAERLARRRRAVSLRRPDRQHGRRHERQRGGGRAEAVARRHVVARTASGASAASPAAASAASPSRTTAICRTPSLVTVVALAVVGLPLAASGRRRAARPRMSTRQIRAAAHADRLSRRHGRAVLDDPGRRRARLGSALSAPGNRHRSRHRRLCLCRLFRRHGDDALPRRRRAQPLRRGDDAALSPAWSPPPACASAACRHGHGWPSPPSPSAASASPTWCRSPFRPAATSRACRPAPA